MSARPFSHGDPVGVGIDGACYAATDDGGNAVTLHRTGPMTPERRADLARRLALLRTNPPPHAARLLHTDDDGTLIVLERAPKTAGQVIGPPAPRALVLAAGTAMAECLAALHSEGLLHGAITPHIVGLFEDGRISVDVLPLATALHDDALSRACRAPEQGVGRQDASTDAFAVGAVLLALSGGRAALEGRFGSAADATTNDRRDEALDPLAVLINELLDAEPAWRPGLYDVRERLRTLAVSAAAPTAGPPARPLHAEPADAADEDNASLSRVGRFALEEKIGEGAMGRVYRARDLRDGTLVAVKLLARDGAPSRRALKRFKKEARILGELKNPGIAGLVDAGEDRGRLYMAVELVSGKTLASVLRERGPLPEQEALSLVADIARAMVDVHAAGVVHRDIKPDNILVVDAALRAVKGSQIKLIDFGIARHLDESESLAITRQGAILGTPLYMAPEQAKGGDVDPRSDIYAIGSMLYELLTGRAPFSGLGAAAVIASQIEAPVPDVRGLRGDVKDATARLISQCVDKDPANRPQDARDLLARLLQLLEIADVDIGSHPRQPADDGVLQYVFEWSLTAAPALLWPYVSNTDRLNRAIGLGAVEESFERVGDEIARIGHSRQVGFGLSWREHPFEWVHQRRLGVLREYSEGPLRWLRSTVDLHPTATGTRLVHTVTLEPRGLMGRAAAAVEIGIKTRRALERVYTRIDQLVRGDGGIGDPFEERTTLPPDRAERLAALEQATVAGGADARAVALLGDWLKSAPTMELSRIRPLALAKKLGVDADTAIRTCLLAARHGLLVPLWDLLCPSCRAPAGFEETLKALREHGRCEVCNIEFALDLATTIELVFRVHGQVRSADVGTYCLGSPIKTPHVMAQVRLAPDEHFAFDIKLPDGAYQLVGPRLGYAVAFRAREGELPHRWDLSLKAGPPADLPRLLGAGAQQLCVVNDTGREQLVRIESTAQRDDLLTAARASAHPLFRELFPSEVLRAGSLVRIASVTLWVAELSGAALRAAVDGDSASFSQLYSLFKAIEEQVAAAGGATVKLLGDGLLAVFDSPEQALRAALSTPAALAKLNHDARVRVAIHRGPAAAVSLNDRLDYFGHAVFRVVEMASSAQPGTLVLSEQLVADPPLLGAIDTGLKDKRLELVRLEETLTLRLL